MTQPRRDVEAAMAAAARVADGQPSSSDDELARLACALTDPQVRDTLYALAVGEDAGQAESLWAVLSRTLPEPWRVEALVLLAFSAYARGDGPLAGVSLEAALRCDVDAPDGRHARHRPAVGDAARDRFVSSPITGYRLAERLGVQLPRGGRSGGGPDERCRLVRPFRPSRRAPCGGAARPARGRGSRS